MVSVNARFRAISAPTQPIERLHSMEVWVNAILIAGNFCLAAGGAYNRDSMESTRNPGWIEILRIKRKGGITAANESVVSLGSAAWIEAAWIEMERLFAAGVELTWANQV
jgi:hypothetical protein